jgi:hypothetical protein
LLTEASATHADDRTVSRSMLQAHLATLDLDDVPSVLSSFVLVVAWGSGTTNTRSLRYTPLALTNPGLAAAELVGAVTALRRDGDLAGAYTRFQLPGVGQSFATRWFALAGRREDRDWQPLVLDARVRTALEALGVSIAGIRGGRRSRALAYEEYVRALHCWAAELRAENPSCRGEMLEWLLSDHGIDGWRT